MTAETSNNVRDHILFADFCVILERHDILDVYAPDVMEKLRAAFAEVVASLERGR